MKIARGRRVRRDESLSDRHRENRKICQLYREARPSLGPFARLVDSWHPDSTFRDCEQWLQRVRLMVTAHSSSAAIMTGPEVIG